MKYRHLLFQLVPSTLRTDGTESGLLPTATAQDYGSNQSPSKGAAVRPSLGSIMKLLPTPSALNIDRKRDLSKMSPKGHWGKNMNTGNLGEAISRMLPTPRGADGNKGIRTQEGHEKERLRRGNGEDLPTRIGVNRGLKLQPAFVEWMMGYPEGWTELPDSKVLEMRSSRKSQRK